MVLLGLGCGQEALKAVTHWGVARILELGCCQEALKAGALTAQSPRPLLSSIMMFSWGSWRPSIFWRSSSKWRFHWASSEATFGFLADKGYILGWKLLKMGKYNTTSLKNNHNRHQTPNVSIYYMCIVQHYLITSLNLNGNQFSEIHDSPVIYMGYSTKLHTSKYWPHTSCWTFHHSLQLEQLSWWIFHLKNILNIRFFLAKTWHRRGQKWLCSSLMPAHESDSQQQCSQLSN